MTLFITNIVEVHYEPVRIRSFCSNNYIKCKSSSDKHETLSIKKILKEIKPYLKDIINNLKKSETRKIQVTKGINF